MNPFIHPAVFYRDDAEYLAVLVPFVTDWLAQGLPVAAAVPGDRLRLLREGLGTAAREVHLLDMAEVGRNPGRIIPRVLGQFAGTHAGTHARIIGEPIWAGRSDTEYPACAQHEALINAAFDGTELTILCPYDTATLDAQVLADARATHPTVWEAGQPAPCPDYDQQVVLTRYNQPLPEAEGAAVLPVTELAQLRASRRFAAAQARALGLPEPRIPELELIVTELVANSLRHADGRCRLALWAEGDHLVCQTSDGGHLTDLLAGRRQPDRGAHSGRGLWLINDLADLVRLHTSPAGTTPRVLLRFS